MHFTRQRKFEAKEGSRGLLKGETSVSLDTGLVKACISYLMLFSVGVAHPSCSFVWLYVAHLSRTLLCLFVLGYGLTRTTYFLSLLNYSGI